MKTPTRSFSKHSNPYGRLRMLVAILGICFGLLALRLVYLQVLQGEKYQTLARNNSIRLIQSRAPRGLITDRNGEELVGNVPTFTVALLPINLREMDYTIQVLSRMLSMDPEEIYEKIIRQSGTPYLAVKVKENVPREIIAAIEEKKDELIGIQILTESRRFYRYHDLAAHVLGYTSRITEQQLDTLKVSGYGHDDIVGQMGVEKVYDAWLRGEPGGKEIEVDHRGRIQSKSLLNLHSREARPGHKVLLTVDLDLQELSENLLRGSAGAIIVMNPKNGEILAMASQPSFDLNTFAEGISYADWNRFSRDPMTPLSHRAIQGLYPPGSIFKIVTASAGLEETMINSKTGQMERVMDTHTVFECNGSFWIKTWIYRCWNRMGHSYTDIYKSLCQSCDVFFYRVGLRLKAKKLAKWATAFGFGQKTGIDLSGELSGFVPTPEWKEKTQHAPWFPGNTVQFSIGQGYLLGTPLQVAQIANAIAANGVVYRPHIVRRIETLEGKTVFRAHREVERRIDLSQETLDILHEGLRQVIHGYGGTGWRSRIKGVVLCGKTGTSENPHGRPHAWFTVYGPKEDPEISVTILIENGEEGGLTAAPLAQQILQMYFDKKAGKLEQRGGVGLTTTAKTN